MELHVIWLICHGCAGLVALSIAFGVIWPEAGLCFAGFLLRALIVILRNVALSHYHHLFCCNFLFTQRLEVAKDEICRSYAARILRILTCYPTAGPTALIWYLTE